MSSINSDRSDTSSPVSISSNIGATGISIDDKVMENMDTQVDSQTTDKEMSLQDNVPGTSSAPTNIGGIDQLLQKHRNEIMFELRRLQMGDRPVTGQGHKEAVENFFTRAMNTDPQQATDDGEHRPEHVTVEVNALVERRPVSSILQSAGFRRNLETALRGALSNIPAPPQSVRPRTTQPTPELAGVLTPAPERSATPEQSGHVSQQSLRQPTPTPRNNTHQPPRAVSTQQQPAQRSNMNQQISQRQAVNQQLSQRQAVNQQLSQRQAVNQQLSQRQAVNQQLSQRQAVNQQRNQRDAAQRPTPSPRQHVAPGTPELPNAPSGPALAQQWLLQQVPTHTNPSEVHQATVQELLDQEHREELIADISELVQRQLVTSSLEGHFRGRLEHLMMAHLDSTQVDGRRVQQMVQNLPPRPTPRNDFSHLGISQALSDNLDDISVISATAAVTVPYAQSNAALSREMVAIKAQLTDLRNMMRMSFDVQLDIQRAIRQEVSATVNNVMNDMSQDYGSSVDPMPMPSAPTSSQSPSQPARESHCLICLDQYVDSLLYQCGHMCVCYGCGMNLRSRGSHCPVCRAPIRDVVRAYRTNQD